MNHRTSVARYFDLSSNGFYAHHNLVYNVSGAVLQWNTKAAAPILLGAPVASRVENNVFVASRLWPSHPSPLLIWNGYSESTFERNIVVVAADRPSLFEGTTCRQKMGAAGDNRAAGFNCTDLFVDNFKRASFDSNLYFNTSGAVTDSFPGPTGGETGSATSKGSLSFAAWRAEYGHDNNSIVDRDPRFVNPACSDYRVGPDSPALALSFEPLGLEHAGVGPSWPFAEQRAVGGDEPRQLPPEASGVV